ncbi:hypothetical protein OHB49_00745 [Streptomyces sp. NBC_01717]|uniref:hypothetical protein n=1 Tax=Streptomyces sp. NBC_01717 TaxID=2975918 RepID=UPI002E3648ED|nr:hypothetical protein [Streptomyces sp. NBC_01717]
MAGVNGWYPAIGWNQPGIASSGAAASIRVPEPPGRGQRGRRLGGRATRSFGTVLMPALALAPMPGRPGWSPLALAEQSGDHPPRDLNRGPVAGDSLIHVGADGLPAVTPPSQGQQQPIRRQGGTVTRTTW